MKKRTLSIFLACSLALGLFVLPASAAGEGYSDTAGHWAEDSIKRWSQYHIVEGNKGQFYPDIVLTRGQMAKILSGVLCLTEGGEGPFYRRGT